MRILPSHSAVRLTGRWDTSKPDAATTVNTGAYIEFAFEGDMATVLFDTYENASPALHLWISVDGGAMTETPIDNYLRINAPDGGKHVVRIIYKGGQEASSRWYSPLHGKVTFLGVIADAPAELVEDNRPIIEFVGDSITEGVLVDEDFKNIGLFMHDVEHLNRPYQDDVCGTYAWLTAEALDMRPVIMGFGAVGVTKGGQGRVPAVHIAYPYNFDGSPITRQAPRMIVLNHGTNDPQTNAPNFIDKYKLTLDVIRQKEPDAIVVSLAPFCGKFHNELAELVREYNEQNNCSVYYIDSFGWIPPTPIHPLRDGHREVAKNLVPILRDILNKA